MVKRRGEVLDLLHRLVEEGMSLQALCPCDHRQLPRSSGCGTFREPKHFLVQSARGLMGLLLGGQPRMESWSFGLHGTPDF